MSGHVGQLVVIVVQPQLHRLGKARDLGRGLGAGAQRRSPVRRRAAGAGGSAPGDRCTARRCPWARRSCGRTGSSGPRPSPPGRRGPSKSPAPRRSAAGHGCLPPSAAGQRCPPPGNTQPVSLFTSITDTRTVSSRRASATCSAVTLPVPSGLQIGDLIPLLLQQLAGLQHGAVLHGGGDDVLAPVPVLPQRRPGWPSCRSPCRRR